MISSQPPFEALTALHPLDRRWLLARLAPEQRRTLLSLLDRPPSDAPIGAAATSDHGSEPSGVRAVRSAQMRSPDELYLLSAKAEEIHAVLSALPRGCAVALLRHTRWSWSTAVLSLLSDREKQKVGDPAGLQASAAFMEWLLHAVVEGVRAGRQSKAGDLPPNKRFEVFLD